MEKFRSTPTHHAMLFAYIAKEAIDSCGEAGKEAVKAGVIKYGRQRGHRMALRTLADGKPLNVDNYMLYGEWSAEPGTMQIGVSEYSPEVRMESSMCPWNKAWVDSGLLDYGIYYCAGVDEALAEGYNGMKLELAANRSMGDDKCIFVFKGCGMDPDRVSAYLAAREELGDRAKMPWDYHIGHLYSAMRYEFRAVLGDETADGILSRALDIYRGRYGDEAAAQVLEFADLNYDVLPE